MFHMEHFSAQLIDNLDSPEQNPIHRRTKSENTRPRIHPAALRSPCHRLLCPRSRFDVPLPTCALISSLPSVSTTLPLCCSANATRRTLFPPASQPSIASPAACHAALSARSPARPPPDA